MHNSKDTRKETYSGPERRQHRRLVESMSEEQLRRAVELMNEMYPGWQKGFTKHAFK